MKDLTGGGIRVEFHAGRRANEPASARLVPEDSVRWSVDGLFGPVVWSVSGKLSEDDNFRLERGKAIMSASGIIGLDASLSAVCLREDLAAYFVYAKTNGQAEADLDACFGAVAGLPGWPVSFFQVWHPQMGTVVGKRLPVFLAAQAWRAYLSAAICEDLTIGPWERGSFASGDTDHAGSFGGGSRLSSTLRPPGAVSPRGKGVQERLDALSVGRRPTSADMGLDGAGQTSGGGLALTLDSPGAAAPEGQRVQAGSVASGIGTPTAAAEAGFEEAGQGSDDNGSLQLDDDDSDISEAASGAPVGADVASTGDCVMCSEGRAQKRFTCCGSLYHMKCLLLASAQKEPRKKDAPVVTTCGDCDSHGICSWSTGKVPCGGCTFPNLREAVICRGCGKQNPNGGTIAQSLGGPKYCFICNKVGALTVCSVCGLADAHLACIHREFKLKDTRVSTVMICGGCVLRSGHQRPAEKADQPILIPKGKCVACRQCGCFVVAETPCFGCGAITPDAKANPLVLVKKRKTDVTASGKSDSISDEGRVTALAAGDAADATFETCNVNEPNLARRVAEMLTTLAGACAGGAMPDPFLVRIMTGSDQLSVHRAYVHRDTEVACIADIVRAALDEFPQIQARFGIRREDSRFQEYIPVSERDKLTLSSANFGDYAVIHFKGVPFGGARTRVANPQGPATVARPQTRSARKGIPPPVLPTAILVGKKSPAPKVKASKAAQAAAKAAKAKAKAEAAAASKAVTEKAKADAAADAETLAEAELAKATTDATDAAAAIRVATAMDAATAAEKATANLQAAQAALAAAEIEAVAADIAAAAAAAEIALAHGIVRPDGASESAAGSAADATAQNRNARALFGGRSGRGRQAGGGRDGGGRQSGQRPPAQSQTSKTGHQEIIDITNSWVCGECQWSNWMHRVRCRKCDAAPKSPPGLATPRPPPGAGGGGRTGSRASADGADLSPLNPKVQRQIAAFLASGPLQSRVEWSPPVRRSFVPEADVLQHRIEQCDQGIVVGRNGLRTVDGIVVYIARFSGSDVEKMEQLTFAFRMFTERKRKEFISDGFNINKRALTAFMTNADLASDRVAQLRGHGATVVAHERVRHAMVLRPARLDNGEQGYPGLLDLVMGQFPAGSVLAWFSTLGERGEIVGLNTLLLALGDMVDVLAFVFGETPSNTWRDALNPLLGLLSHRDVNHSPVQFLREAIERTFRGWVNLCSHPLVVDDVQVCARPSITAQCILAQEFGQTDFSAIALGRWLASRDTRRVDGGHGGGSSGSGREREIRSEKICIANTLRLLRLPALDRANCPGELCPRIHFTRDDCQSDAPRVLACIRDCVFAPFEAHKAATIAAVLALSTA